MKNSIIFISIILSILTACGQQKSLKDIDLDKGEYSLYFIDYTIFVSFGYDECDFQKKNHFFKITDENVLTDIQNNLNKTVKNINPQQIKCFHDLKLFKNNEQVWEGTADWDNDMLFNSDEKFEIESDFLQNLNENFIKVPVYSFRIKELETARLLYNQLIKNDVLIISIELSDNESLFTFNGTTEIQINDLDISNDDNIIINESKLRERLKKCGKFQIRNIRNDIENNKTDINLFIERDIKNDLPNDIRIIVPYAPWKDILYKVIDVKEEQIKKIIEENNYKGIRYIKK